MRIDAVSIFPEWFEPWSASSIVGRARRRGLLDLRLIDLREFTDDAHRTVDDYPYGGGGGMVMKPEPFFRCRDALLREAESQEGGARPFFVLMSARGRLLDQSLLKELAVKEWLIVLCGHYKGVDARVESFVDLEVSIGDYVLSGGEIPAMVLMDGVVRLLPGVVGSHDSIAGDSHYDGLLGPPEYTRPPEYRGMRVPQVLLSGDHAAIEEWRRRRVEELTRLRRPDLWERFEKGRKDGHRTADREGRDSGAQQGDT